MRFLFKVIFLHISVLRASSWKHVQMFVLLVVIAVYKYGTPWERKWLLWRYNLSGCSISFASEVTIFSYNYWFL